jgi:hypothetical protein
MKTMLTTAKARIVEIDRQIAALHRERADLSMKVAESISPFKCGDVIEWRGRRGRVDSIREWCSEVMWCVTRIKKDGSIGREAKVYSWQHPAKVEMQWP